MGKYSLSEEEVLKAYQLMLENYNENVDIEVLTVLFSMTRYGVNWLFSHCILKNDCNNLEELNSKLINYSEALKIGKNYLLNDERILNSTSVVYITYALGTLFCDDNEENREYYNLETAIYFFTYGFKFVKAPELAEAIGLIYLNEEYKFYDIKKAEDYFVEAITYSEEGEEKVDMCCNIGKYYLDKNSKLYNEETASRYFDKALELVKLLKDKEEIEPEQKDNPYIYICKIGRFYEYELDNKKLAEKYYLVAAENNLFVAMLELARLYYAVMYVEYGVKECLEKSIYWLEKCLYNYNLDNIVISVILEQLVHMITNDNITKEKLKEILINYEEKYSYEKSFYDEIDINNMNHKSMLFEEIGEKEKAQYFCGQASNLGDSVAKSHQTYQQKQNDEISDSEEIRLYKESAMLSESTAMFNLGFLLKDSDEEESFKWFLEAFKNGDMDSAYFIA